MALKFFKLDRGSIRHLKPGEKVTEHSITAERLDDGDTRYSVNVMVDGERIHRVIGRSSDGTTRTQAEEYIQAKRSEAREGRLNLPKGRKTPLNFSMAAELYLKGEREIGAKDITVKERNLKLHLKPYFGRMRIDRISEFNVETLFKFGDIFFGYFVLNGGNLFDLSTYLIVFLSMEFGIPKYIE